MELMRPGRRGGTATISASAARQFCIESNGLEPAVSVGEIQGDVIGVQKETYDTRSVPVPPIRIVHRRYVDPTLVHEIIIGDHNPRERPQEHSVSVHETEESLNAERKIS